MRSFRPARSRVFRKLATLDYFTNYSHRGGFYTLSSVARLDDQGLSQDRWRVYFYDWLIGEIHAAAAGAMRTAIYRRRQEPKVSAMS
jgi:hypothetical protein